MTDCLSLIFPTTVSYLNLVLMLALSLETVILEFYHALNFFFFVKIGAEGVK